MKYAVAVVLLAFAASQGTSLSTGDALDPYGTGERSHPGCPEREAFEEVEDALEDPSSAGVPLVALSSPDCPVTGIGPLLRPVRPHTAAPLCLRL